jgi:hypothetical protein
VLQRVCRRLSDIYSQQAESRDFRTTRELDLLFQLHSLLILTRDGCLCRQQWDVKKYREALPYLWLPLRRSA